MAGGCWSGLRDGLGDGRRLPVRFEGWSGTRGRAAGWAGGVCSAAGAALADPRLPALRPTCTPLLPLAQRGIDLPSLDPSYFTSLSYYILLLFGLRGVLTLMFRCGAGGGAARARLRLRACRGGAAGELAAGLASCGCSARRWHGRWRARP